MSKKVTKMNQEAENQEMMDNKQEAEVVETRKGVIITEKVNRFCKKALPYVLGALCGVGCCALFMAIGSKNAEEVIDNISNALPDHGGNDFTGIGMTEENKTE